LPLQDIQCAIEKIRSFTGGMNFEKFRLDEKTHDAVIRNLEIIGEAARSLPEDFLEQAREVEWRKIVALRNVLIHEYFGINLRIIWDVVVEKLPDVHAACTRLIEQA